MTVQDGAYEAVIADLEADAAKAEATATRLREMIAMLRARATVRDRPPVFGIITGDGAAKAAAGIAAQLRQTAQFLGRVAPPPPKRGDTTRIVLDAIRENPNKTSAELADIVAPTLGRSDLRRARKLVHSTASYLVSVRRAIKDEKTGRLAAP